MANPTTNFNFVMPTPTDLVTDLPADFEVFGQAVDTQLATLTTKIEFNNQTGTTYTLAAGDLAKLVTCSNGSAITVTIPPSVFVAGNVINLQQIGVGQAPKLRSRYSGCSIICTASNTFTILGDLV